MKSVEYQRSTRSTGMFKRDIRCSSPWYGMVALWDFEVTLITIVNMNQITKIYTYIISKSLRKEGRGKKELSSGYSKGVDRTALEVSWLR